MASKTKAMDTNTLPYAQGYRINKAFAAMNAVVTEQFGKRCAEFEYGCPVCRAWRHIDDLHSMICD